MAFPDTAVKNFTHRAAAAAALSAQTRAQNVTGNASACATGNASDGGKDVGRGLSPSSHFFSRREETFANREANSALNSRNKNVRYDRALLDVLRSK